MHRLHTALLAMNTVRRGSVVGFPDEACTVPVPVSSEFSFLLPMLPSDQPVPLTCPACGAVLLLHPSTSTFRCSLGHEFLPEQLAKASDTALTRTLWACLRQLEERHWLLAQLVCADRKRSIALPLQKSKGAQWLCYSGLQNVVAVGFKDYSTAAAIVGTASSCRSASVRLRSWPASG